MQLYDIRVFVVDEEKQESDWSSFNGIRAHNPVEAIEEGVFGLTFGLDYRIYVRNSTQGNQISFVYDITTKAI